MARDIDDVRKRREYKEVVYAGSEFTSDEYTGNPMVRGISDTDHITPIKKIRKRYSGLTTGQQKKLANNEAYNFAETNPGLNRSKGCMENHEYLLRQWQKGEPEEVGTVFRMLSKEVESRVLMRVEATGMYAENLAEDGKRFIEDNLHIGGEVLDAATQAALLSGTTSVIRNIRQVSVGKKNGQDAWKDVNTDIAGVATTAYSMTAISKGIADGLGVSEDTAAVLASGSIQIAKSVTAYTQCNISFEQMQEEVTEKSAMIISSYIGKDVGGFLGSEVGAVAGAVLVPTGGGAAGAEFGHRIGEFVGEIVTTAICVNIIEEVRCSKSFVSETSRITAMADRAEREIRDAQSRLKENIDCENRDFLVKTDAGFAMMMEGIHTCDYGQVKDGIMQIGMKFGMTEAELTEGMVKRGHVFDRAGEALEIC